MVLGEIRITQGRLADRTPGVAPTSTIQVTSLTALTDADKSKGDCSCIGC